MDDLSTLLRGADSPRPLPAALRLRLEGLVLGRQTESIWPSFAVVDAPRPIPTQLRRRLALAIGATVRRRPAPLWTWTMAGAVAAVLVSGLVILGTRTAPTGAPRAVATPTRTPLQPLVPAVPSPSPAQLPQAGSVEVCAPATAGTGTRDAPAPLTATPGCPATYTLQSGGASRLPSSPSGDTYCFPDEHCPPPYAAAIPAPSQAEQDPPAAPKRGPSSPRNMQASWSAPGEAVLRWDPPEDAGTSSVRRYGIYRSTAEGSEEFVASIDAATTVFRDTGLPTGTHYYRVRAANYDRLGEYSAPVSVFVIGSPVPSG